MRYRKWDCRRVTARFPWTLWTKIRWASSRESPVSHMVEAMGGRSRGSIVFNCSRAMVPHASCETILVEGDMALVSSR